MSYVWTPEQVRDHYPTPYSLPFHHMTAYASYRTTPEFVAEVLPPCLSPTDDPIVTISLMAMIDRRNDVLAVGQRDRGALIGVNCAYQGEVGSYFLTVIETEETNIEKGREFWGMPKKQGTVDIFDDGRLVYGYADRKNARLVDFVATLGDAEPVDAESIAHSVYFELKGFMDPTAKQALRPQLVICDVESTTRRSQPISSVDLTLGQSPWDPGIATVPVGDFVGGGYVAGVDTYKMRDVVELEHDGNEYAGYILGRMYTALL